MKKLLLSLLLLSSVVAVSVPAAATPFVTNNSSYSFYINQGNNAFRGDALFDGKAETAQYGNLLLSATESETELEDGFSRITFELKANGSLFPVAEDEFFFGIGTDAAQNGFDFNSLVNLQSVTVSLFDITGLVFDITEGLEGSVDQRTPWNGLFLGIDNNLGLTVDDATQVAGIRVEFVVGGQSTEVPEPGSILLSGIGLLAGFAALRRRRS